MSVMKPDSCKMSCTSSQCYYSFIRDHWFHYSYLLRIEYHLTSSLASAPKRDALMEWNQILWKGDSNFSSLIVGHNKSRSFRSVWGCLIKKNVSICTMISELENFAMHEITFSVSSVFFIYQFVVHSGFLWYVKIEWWVDDLNISKIYL
jgi:hypothetical protein